MRARLFSDISISPLKIPSLIKIKSNLLVQRYIKKFLKKQIEVLPRQTQKECLSISINTVGLHKSFTFKFWAVQPVHKEHSRDSPQSVIKKRSPLQRAKVQKPQVYYLEW